MSLKEQFYLSCMIGDKVEQLDSIYQVACNKTLIDFYKNLVCNENKLCFLDQEALRKALVFHHKQNKFSLCKIFDLEKDISFKKLIGIKIVKSSFFIFCPFVLTKMLFNLSFFDKRILLLKSFCWTLFGLLIYFNLSLSFMFFLISTISYWWYRKNSDSFISFVLFCSLPILVPFALMIFVGLFSFGTVQEFVSIGDDEIYPYF